MSSPEIIRVKRPNEMIEIPLDAIVGYVRVEEDRKHPRDRTNPGIRGGTYMDIAKHVRDDYNQTSIECTVQALREAENAGLIKGVSPCVVRPGYRGGAKRWTVVRAGGEDCP